MMMMMIDNVDDADDYNDDDDYDNYDCRMFCNLINSDDIELSVYAERPWSQ